ncbi:hypothetical protein CI109_106366 [Kwoniella shandongensis]|uniref:Uncharacterized protein n=1 Tax=Kwoniella shandongensis TaxID=1734106 RepID=A0A5M6BSE8_9TREE|nr:uncharacterized protein CI109_005929 [Kwoniella shandongensis]KAA5525766.1 hypothetical protein CI109_005929 [Kwoniella shandongensis]
MSPIPTLGFKCALITGGGGGLGKAMAIDLISRGKKVLLAGRSEANLKSTASEIGAAGYYVVDTGDIPSLSAFIEKIISEHPDLDCLINNAGVQTPLEVLGPDYEFDLTKADKEIDINIRGPIHLSVGLIKNHFSKNLKDQGAVIMNVTSVLGFVPTSVVNPVYNGTKSFLHSFTTNLRTQLDQVGSKIKVVEIVPPQVETDLHRTRKDPNDNKKSHPMGKNALTIEEFMDGVKEGWENDNDIIGPGMAKKAVDNWQNTFGKAYQDGVDAQKKK